ncbi:MAG: hypothetical protein HY851_11140 [candidate division Zixibacteria bacterium]|nr:hypothetical protein [candidate division Zixibacteria bacterium]
MFTFHRVRAGAAEIWDILVAPGVIPDAEVRFGRPMHHLHPAQESPFHEVGTLVAIRDDGKQEVELLVVGKDRLTEAEVNTLLRELELLLGKSCWTMGAEIVPAGWVLRDCLRPSGMKTGSIGSR